MEYFVTVVLHGLCRALTLVPIRQGWNVILHLSPVQVLMS